MGNGKPISGVIDQIKKDTEGEDIIKVGELLDSFGERSFGPLLLIPALLALTPIGAVPLIPTMMALVVATVACQLVFGLDHPWVPNIVEDLSVKRSKLVGAFDKLKTPIAWFERLTKPRWEEMTEGLARKITGAVCFFIALAMVPLEIVPLAVFIPAIALCLLSASLITSDGVVATIGLLVSSLVIYLAVSSVTSFL